MEFRRATLACNVEVDGETLQTTPLRTFFTGVYVSKTIQKIDVAIVFLQIPINNSCLKGGSEFLKILGLASR